MSKIESLIGTDTKGKSELKISMKDMVFQMSSFVDDEEYAENFISTTKQFSNMVDFIQYITDNGKEILENIRGHVCDYQMTMPLPDYGSIRILLSDHRHINIYMDMSADFITEEMKEDKETLRQIEELAQKRIDWYRNGGN